MREVYNGVDKPICSRAVHISDGAPRNFHIFCGKFEINKKKGFEVTRKGCKMKKKGRDCVGLKVTIFLFPQKVKLSNAVCRMHHIHYRWLGQGFCASFVLKIAPQMGEGEKREGVQIAKQSTQNL